MPHCGLKNITTEMVGVIEAIASTDEDTFYLVAGPNSRAKLVDLAERARDMLVGLENCCAAIEIENKRLRAIILASAMTNESGIQVTLHE